MNASKPFVVFIHALVVWYFLTGKAPKAEAAVPQRQTSKPKATLSDNSFEKVQLFGRNYVDISRWASAAECTVRWLKPREEVLVQNSKFKLLLKTDSKRAELNGIEIWLSAPIVPYQTFVAIADSDLQNLVHPLLYPPRRTGVIRTIVLDPGHGGVDRGKVVGRHEEKAYTLALSFTLKALLEAKGYRVEMTRTTDLTLELDDRPAIAKKANGDLFVSLHFNSAGSAGNDVRGVEVYCITPAGENSTNNATDQADRGITPGNRYEDQSVLLGFQVQKALVNRLSLGDRGLRRARFAVLRLAPMPSILVEGGFLSNPTEANLIATASHRKKTAEAIAAGILTYIEKTRPLTSPKSPSKLQKTTATKSRKTNDQK